MDDDVDAIAEAGERLVDGVVDDLVHHVVQAGAVIGVADVHAGALAHRLQALEDLDALLVVIAAVVAVVAVAVRSCPSSAVQIVITRAGRAENRSSGAVSRLATNLNVSII